MACLNAFFDQSYTIVTQATSDIWEPSTRKNCTSAFIMNAMFSVYHVNMDNSRHLLVLTKCQCDWIGSSIRMHNAQCTMHNEDQWRWVEKKGKRKSIEAYSIEPRFLYCKCAIDKQFTVYNRNIPKRQRNEVKNAKSNKWNQKHIFIGKKEGICANFCEVFLKKKIEEEKRV